MAVSLRRSSHAGRILVRRFESPLGTLVGAATDQGICLLGFADTGTFEREIADLCRRLGADTGSGDNEHLARLRDEMKEYFAQKRRTFEVSLVTPGTEFQRRVWADLASIRFGRTRTYSDIAHRIGRPAAVRAVGAANGANRIGIVVPCHRVIGANGTLTGYGGGLWRKRRLLELEGFAFAGADAD
jgi:AraC family transcriptional regulator of adaptative response/methylated-DNA-[protein]-cysteine methyltransferase